MILAGGTGIRMGVVDKPKQLVVVYGKPLIIQALESFDRH
nr:NTP transferase domain-containing protein [Fonticella tunisiensis]